MRYIRWPHGGKREGAGRPRIGKKKAVSITLPEEEWARIDEFITDGHVKSYSEYFRILHDNQK